MIRITSEAFSLDVYYVVGVCFAVPINIFDHDSLLFWFIINEIPSSLRNISPTSSTCSICVRNNDVPS